MQRRRPDADGNIGSIKPSSSSKNRASSPGGELGEQLARRTQLLEQVLEHAPPTRAPLEQGPAIITHKAKSLTTCNKTSPQCKTYPQSCLGYLLHDMLFFVDWL